MNKDLSISTEAELFQQDSSGFGKVIDAKEHLRITEKTVLPKLEPKIKFGEVVVAVDGDTIMISGAEKCGKTALQRVLVSESISEDECDGFPGLYIQPNELQKAIVHAETEQSLYVHQYNLISNLKRAGLSVSPEYYRSYNYVGLSLEEYETTLENNCENALAMFGGIHMIIVDGAADFIADVNDSEDSTRLIKFLTGLAAKYSTVVVVIVHTNYGSPKERGHVGSGLRRKCASVLNVQIEDGVSTVTPALLRHGGKEDFPNVQFRFDKSKGYHVSCGETSFKPKLKDEDSVRIERVRKIAGIAFAPPASYTYGDAIDKIMQVSKKSESIAKAMFKDMKAHKMINQGEDKNWRLKIDEINGIDFQNLQSV